MIPPDGHRSLMNRFFVCLGLTVPVLVAAYLVYRHEENQGETD